MKKCFMLLIFLTQIAVFGQSVKNTTKRTIDQKLDYFLKLADSLRIKTNTQGVGMAIVYDGKIIYQGGIGYRDAVEKKPVTKNTLFAIGSVTKPMTGIIASKLVEKGLLDWNTPIKKYYPEFAVADSYVTKNATMIDLFTHTTGVGRYELMYYQNSLITRDEILSKLPLLESKSSFRQQYGYNNFMYLVAGVVEEKVSGKKWENLVKEELFNPLKMETSFTGFKDFMEYKERSNGYKPDGITEVDYQNIDIIAPAGSISSTPHDMALWIKMLANKGAVDNTDFLNENQFNYVTGPHAPFKPTHSISTSIGWIMGFQNGKKWIQKEGAIDGFRSKVTIVPEKKFGIVIMTNNWSNYISLINDYATEIFDEDNHVRNYELEKSLEYKEEKKKRIISKKQIPLLHETDEYIGKYQDKTYGNITISKKNKKLHFEFNDFESKMEHIGFNNFKVKLKISGYNEVYKLHFHTAINGEIDAIEINLESKMPISIFKKIKKPH
ncbi:serine hydrolase [Aquimarina sp. Aq78]|uniref:serine hydrolase n=1 Tax=Aquimarina sp. Aq78 TaxID=1191889 RepID=UPI000D108CB7|nr:serine hydrolase [Aquimarina sp. Aq78]